MVVYDKLLTNVSEYFVSGGCDDVWIVDKMPDAVISSEFNFFHGSLPLIASLSRIDSMAIVQNSPRESA